MKEWFDNNNKNLARIGSVLILLTTTFLMTISFLSWESNSGTISKFDFAIFFTFITSLLSWVWLEIKCWPESEHPHDLQLMNQIRKIFHREFVRDLKGLDLGATFDDEFLKAFKPLIINSESVEFEFFDKKLQKRFKRLLSLASEFYYGVAEVGGPVGKGMYSILSDDERAKDWFEPNTKEKVDRINDLATEVLRAYKELIRHSRKVLPSAFLDTSIKE